MDFQDLVNTPRKVKTLAGTIAFLVLFPAYFTVMPSLIDEEIGGGSSSGLTGTLIVSFEESETSLDETVVLGDGETHDTFFDLMTEPNVNVGYVEFSVSCFDNDDPGPGFTDSVEGTSDLSGLDGLENQTMEGQCSGGDAGFTMRWDLTDNYTGTEYTEEGQSESEIRDRWTDGGLGRGTWAATITADISSPPAPIVGQIIDSDEEFDITWTAVTYTVVIESA